MFHMLSYFDLKKGVTIDEFRTSNNQFGAHMLELGLIDSIGPIGRRQRHPIMDTDNERNQEYFFLMSFANREQCDQAVNCIQAHAEPSETIHDGISSKIENYVFICWADI
jgi:hypothetical protein